MSGDRFLEREESREDVESRNGVVTRNYLQQPVQEPAVDDGRPAVETTDPWDITDGVGS